MFSQDLEIAKWRYYKLYYKCLASWKFVSFQFNIYFYFTETKKIINIYNTTLQHLITTFMLNGYMVTIIFVKYFT